MSFRRRALFLAGLFVAVSCSDAGNPVAPGGPEPDPGAEGVLAVLTCTVDVRAGTETCGPAQPDAGDAQLGLVAIGSAAQVTLNTTNTVSTATSLSYDRSLTNNIYQALGTVDGVTPHPTGIRVWVEPPFMIDTATAGQPTSVTVANADGVLTYKTYKNRPYFQYPGLLQPGATSITDNWAFTLTNVDSFQYKVFVLAEVQFPQGRIRIEPTTPVLQVGTSDTLTALVRGAFQRMTENLTWTSSDPAVVTVAEVPGVDSLGVTTGVSEGTAWIKATSVADPVNRVDSVLVTVNNAPAVPLDSINALQNVSGTVSPARLRQGLAEGDSIVPSQTYDSEHGNAVIDAAGELTYVADPGFFGQDTVLYDVTDGEWTVKRTLLVNVAPAHYWFVREGASGGGSNTQPLGSINAASDSAAAGDTIFVLRNGSNELVGAHTLDAGEALIGAGVPAAFLLEATDLNEANHKDLIFKGEGVGAPLMNTGAPTLTLGSNNLVRGVNISSADAAAIHGIGFGTLTVGDVIVQAGGPALSLANGDLAGSFLALHSTNSDSSGISLTSVGGTLAATGSSITGAATTAFSVNGGTVAITFPGDVTHAGSGRLLQVSSHSGSASFAGALTATAGTGVLFSAAEGSYALNGAVVLNGGDAGVDVSSSGGSFTFANASVTNPTGGPAVHVTGGSPAMFYRGSITHNSGRAVLVDGITADSVVLRAAITSGTSGAPTGQGILVQNLSGGLVALDSTKSLFTGGNAAVTINNAAGAVRFGHAMDITTTTGAGFTASGAGTVTASGLNTVATGTGIPVSLTSVNTGTVGVSFSSISTSTGAPNGIVLNGISGAGFQATGGTVSGTTGAAVQLTNTNNADSVSLRGMTLSRSAGTGAVISGTNFGKLHALGTSVQASGGPGALALTTGTMSGTYSTVSSNASTGSGVSLTSVNGTFNASAGSINTAGAAAFLVSGGSVSGTISGTVAQASAVPLLSVSGGHETGTEVLTFAGNVTATNGNGLQFDNADGRYAFTANVSLQGGDAGIDVTNGSAGDFTFPTSSNIVSPTTGNLVSILNSAPNFTYSGQFTKANNNVTGILVSNNTGGTIMFDGTATKTISSGTAAAVNLANNTGASVVFSGGGLSITSGTGAGFTATGGGTVQVTGGTNTISSGAATALSVLNTTIGASGMSFQSIAANGGANGIVLNNTGSANGLQVTGTGGAGTGGTITATTGDAVSLTSARSVRLTSMNIQNSGGSGVYGSSVTGFSLKSSTVSSNGNAVGEAGLEFENLLGADSVVSSTITGSAEDNLVVRNTSGTLDSLLVLNSTISSNSSIGSDGILVTAANTANATVRVRNSTFTANKGDHFQATASNSAILNVVLFQNTMTGGHPSPLGQGITLGTGLTFTGTFSYDLNDNDILNGPISNAITIDHDGTTGSLMQGRVRNNVIGTSGADLSCSAQASGIEIENGNRGTHTYAVTGNTVRRCYDRGIFLDNGDGSNVTVNATVTGNTVNELTTANARQALYVNVGAFDPNFLGATDSFTVCADIQGNTLTSHSSYSAEAIRLRMRFNSRMNLPGYGGSFNNAANEVNAYLAARNTLTASATATTTAAGAPNGYYNAGASCPTPS